MPAQTPRTKATGPTKRKESRKKKKGLSLIDRWKNRRRLKKKLKKLLNLEEMKLETNLAQEKKQKKRLHKQVVVIEEKMPMKMLSKKEAKRFIKSVLI